MTGPQKSEIDLDRLPALLITQARGDPLRPEDAALLRRAEEEDPDLRIEAQLWAAIGTLGDPRGDGRELSDAALLERVLARTRAEPAPRSTARPRAAPRPMLRRSAAATIAGVAIAATLLVALAAELMGGGDEAPPPAPHGNEVLEPHGARRSAPDLPAPAPPEEAEEASPSTAADAREGGPTAAADAQEAGPTAAADAPEERPTAATGAQEAGPTAAAGEPATTGAAEAPTRALRQPKPRSEEPVMSAEALLLRAQSRLGQGKTAEALAAYRALLARYPGSPEARAALVSLGHITLHQGKAAEALGYFERYLADGGPLAAEARVGRVQCLRRLGRTADERAAIADFLARHGESVHAPRLRARLAELGGK